MPFSYSHILSRPFLLCLFLFSLSVSHVAGQNAETLVSLNERVGEIVDPDERAYFHLFPQIDNFESARLFSTSDSTYLAQIQQRGGSVIERPLTREEFHEIGNYIERYEQVYNRTEEIEWGYLIKHVQPNSTPFNRGVPVGVTLLDDTYLEGRLVHISDRGLLVSKSITPGTPESMEDQVRVIRREEVYRIRQLGTFLEKAFGEFDIFFAGEPDIFYRYSVPILKKYAFYGDAPPSELSRLMPPRTDIPDPGPPRKRDSSLLRDLIFEHLHLRYYITEIPSSYSADPIEVLAFLFTEDEFQRPQTNIQFNKPFLSLTFDVHVAQKIKAGASILWSRLPDQPEFVEQDLPGEGRTRFLQLSGLRTSPGFVEVGGQHLIGKISYDIVSADRVVRVYPRLTFKNFDLTVGAGVSYWNQRSVTTLSSASIEEVGGRWFEYTRNFTERDNLWGAYAELEINFYVSRHLSLGLNLNQFIYPNFTIEDQSLEALGIYEVSKSLTGVDQTLHVTSINGLVAIHF